MIAEMTRRVHAEQWREAALLVADFAKLKLNLDDDPAKCMIPIQWMLHWLLNNDALAEAAQLLWTEKLFDPRPECSQQVWKLFDEANFGLILGASSMSKSYTMGVRLLLEWIRDPQWTTVQLVGPSEKHLEANLFSHLVSLHKSSRLPLPGDIGELYIGLDRRDLTGSITGVIIPMGQTRKAGRLQGGKRKPRPEAHPIFGTLSRKFIFLDEIENVPKGVWHDIDNVMSNLDEVNTAGLKIFGAYNPTNPTDEVGLRATPPFGWGDFNPDKHFRWTSVRGWEVLRLDGERCENVTAGKVIYPGLQTKAGLEQLAKNSGGRNSPGYYTMGRGMYPPGGVELTIIPAGMIHKMRGEFVWFREPTPCGSCDLALEGGSAAPFCLGKFGMATGVKYPPSPEHPNGRIVAFKGKTGRVQPRVALLLEQLFLLPKGNTVAMRDVIIKTCRAAGIRGEFFCVDRTGHGQGVYDLLRNDWSTQVIGVNYSEAPTHERIMIEDQLPPDEVYDRVCSELWFALRAWAEFGYFMIHPQVDMGRLMPQLTNRKFHSTIKNKVESKKDYKSRGFSSPDEADGATLLVHAVRVGAKVSVSMAGSSNLESPEDEMEGWYEAEYKGGVRIDPSNQFDTLDVSIL